MNKRYVQVTIKETGRVLTFPTVTQMYAKLGEEAVGVNIHSLWNALAKKGGKYENEKVKVEYKATVRDTWK